MPRSPRKPRSLAAAVSSLVLAGSGAVLGQGAALAADTPSLMPPPTPVPAQDVRQFACPTDRVPAAGFTDTAGNPFALEIDCLAGYGITSGVTATSYAPGLTVPRAQMAQFLARLATDHAGLPLDPADAGFTDLAALSPAARDAINGLANAGILSGRTATSFDPAGPVQRGQLATFLSRLQDKTGRPFLSGGDAFADDQDSPHEASIDRIAAGGIVTGTGPRAFAPAAPVTRQQMAAFLVRYVADRIQVGELDSAYPVAAPARAVLAGRTVLTSSASGKVPVRLDRPATLSRWGPEDPGGAKVTGDGRFVGFALVADGTDPNRIQITGGNVSTGLPADHRLTDTALLAMSHGGGVGLADATWEFPAGDYHLYVIADGSPVTVELTLGGLAGTTMLAPSVPVAADVARPEHRELSPGVHSAGAPGQVHGERPLLFQVHSVLGRSNFQTSLTGCVYTGEEATARATYAPECPDANLRGSVLAGSDPTAERTLLLSMGAAGAAADTFGQGHSVTSTGVNDHLDFRALWLTI